MKIERASGEQLLLDFVKGFNLPPEIRQNGLAKVISLNLWRKPSFSSQANKQEKEIVSKIISYSKTLGW